MSDLEERAHALYLEIDKLKLLRDAQQPGSRFHTEFQQDIEHATKQWHHCRTVAPKIAELDRAIAALGLKIQSAEMSASDDPWSRAAIVFGIVGGVGLLICFAFDVSWVMWLMSVGLLAAAAGAAFLSVGARRMSQDDADALRAQWEDLHRTRADLLSTD